MTCLVFGQVRLPLEPREAEEDVAQAVFGGGVQCFSISVAVMKCCSVDVFVSFGGSWF